MGKEKRHVNVFFAGQMNFATNNSLIRELGAISRTVIAELEKNPQGPLKYLLEVAKKELRDQSLVWKFETSNYIFCVIDNAEKADCVVVMMTESTTSGFEANIEEHGFLNDGKQIICCCKVDEQIYHAIEGQLSSHFVKSGCNAIIVPISFDEEGNNISKKGSHLDWYNGPTLLEAFNQLSEPISTQGYYYRNKLETYCLRMYQMFPVYITKVEGELHNVKFRSEVKVNDDNFSSLEAHLHRKEAELDAAQVACTNLLSKCDDVTLRIEKDELCAKSILHEFAFKSKSSLPIYSSSIVKEVEMTYWKSSVLFGGVSYVSEDRDKNKRLSEQKAARAALKSILATENHLLLSILIAKRKPASAVVKSSRTAKKQKIASE